MRHLITLCVKICLCEWFNNKLNGQQLGRRDRQASGQRELWEEERGSHQLGTEEAGQAGEVKATRHMAAYGLVEMG